MSELMQSYINSQGEIMKGILDQREDLAREFVALYKDQPIDRVFLFGSGSSWHASVMAQPVIEKALGVEVTCSVPTRMQDLSLICEKAPLFIGTSQGGKSFSTLNKVKELVAAGHKVTAITQEDSTPTAQAASLSVSLRIGEEKVGAKTKGVSGSALTLMLLALELGRAKGTVCQNYYDKTIADLYTAASHVAENARRCIKWVADNAAEMAPSEHILVLAEKCDYGAALEGALKMLETIWRPCVCYEFEEYLHGVANMLCEKTYMLYMLPDGAARERFERLARYAEGKGAKCYLISRGEPVEGARNVNLLSSGNAELSCFEFLVPVQTISAKLSEFCRFDIDKPRYPDFHPTMATKLM